MSLQDQRKRVGLSQSQLATHSGVSVRTIQKYEIGEKNINNAKLLTLLTLSSVLDCSIYDILTDPIVKEKLKFEYDHIYEKRTHSD